MKKIFFLLGICLMTMSSYAQYRWEFTGGILSSNLNLEAENGQSIETNRGVGFQLNIGYGYMLDDRAKSSIVFSGELLQRTSDIASGTDIGQSVEAIQFGFTPKYRLFFGEHIRGFVNVGPSFRINSSVKVAGEKLDSQEFEQVIIGGVYGAGITIAVGEMFDLIAEGGVMNDFVDTIKASNNSKFFDIYARIGIRFRVYDR